MSKLGRYSADRKKIETVTAAKTVEVHDCGTIFIVDAAVALTLPTAATAGAGWWCKVIKGFGAAGGAVTITVTDTLQGIGVDGGGVGVELAGSCTMHTDATEGTCIELISDGTQWYAQGIASTANGFTA